jgi:phage shock protein C
MRKDTIHIAESAMSARPERLVKSRTDRMIDGVCGGIARYFNIDPTLIRISWVLLALLGGAGIILYIAAMILVPAEGRLESKDAGPQTSSPTSNHKFWGFLLIGVGLFWFAHTLGLHFWPTLWAFPWDVTFPVLLILAGVAFLFGGRNYISEPSASGAAAATASEGPEAGQAAISRKRLYRSRRERKILGVCGGIGIHLGIDPVLIRLLFVLAAVASVWFAVISYAVLAIVMTKEPEELSAPAATS